MFELILLCIRYIMLLADKSVMLSLIHAVLSLDNLVYVPELYLSIPGARGTLRTGIGERTFT